MKSIYIFCILLPKSIPGDHQPVTGRVFFILPPRKNEDWYVEKLVFMQNEPIRSGVPAPHLKSPIRNVIPAFGGIEVRIGRVGFAYRRSADHLSEISPKRVLFNPRKINIIRPLVFQPVRVFRVSLSSITLMTTIPIFSLNRVRNYPVIFHGGGFAGRAGWIFRGLRFASSQN